MHLLVRLYRDFRNLNTIERLREINKQLKANEQEYLTAISRLVAEKSILVRSLESARRPTPDLKGFDPLYGSGDLVDVIDQSHDLFGRKGRIAKSIYTIDDQGEHTTYEVYVLAPDKGLGMGPRVEFRASQLVLARRYWDQVKPQPVIRDHRTGRPVGAPGSPQHHTDSVRPLVDRPNY